MSELNSIIRNRIRPPLVMSMDASERKEYGYTSVSETVRTCARIGPRHVRVDIGSPLFQTIARLPPGLRRAWIVNNLLKPWKDGLKQRNLFGLYACTPGYLR